MAYLKFRSDVELEVRRLLADPNDYSSDPDASESHWDRDDMIFWLNKGIKDIRAKRPEAKLLGNTYIDFVEYTETNHTNDAFTILAEKYNNMLVNYIVWKCYKMDDVDEESARKAVEFEVAYGRML